MEEETVMLQERGEEGGEGEGVREGENDPPTEPVAEGEGGSESQAVEKTDSQPEKPQPTVASDSRYLDNDPDPHQINNKKKTAAPPTTKRLTRAERARQEALASFGGTDLASVAVRKRDLREELRRDAKLLEQGEACHNRVKHKTRMQNSSEGVKDVLFGERAVSRKRKLEASSGVVGLEPNPAKTTRRMTKAERARLDALQSFGGCGFDDVLATSRKKMAKTFEMKTEKEGEGEGEGEGEEEEEKENVAAVDVET